MPLMLSAPVPQPYVPASLPVWICSWIQGSILLRFVNIPGDPWSSFCTLFLQPLPQPKPQEVTPARVQAPFLFRHMREPPESPCRRKKPLLPALAASVPPKCSLFPPTKMQNGGQWHFCTSNKVGHGSPGKTAKHSPLSNIPGAYQFTYFFPFLGSH